MYKRQHKYDGERVVIGSVTDGYNPYEEEFHRTRRLLEELRGSDAEIIDVYKRQEEHAGYIRQLCGMANNLNQLARKANAEGFHDERWDCKVAVARIQELITKIGI